MCRKWMQGAEEMYRNDQAGVLLFTFHL